MLERPDAAGLLEAARDVLLRELLPQLPESKRFEARMVANAMAIAGRETAADAAPAAAAATRTRATMTLWRELYTRAHQKMQRETAQLWRRFRRTSLWRRQLMRTTLRMGWVLITRGPWCQWLHRAEHLRSLR